MEYKKSNQYNGLIGAAVLGAAVLIATTIGPCKRTIDNVILPKNGTPFYASTYIGKLKVDRARFADEKGKVKKFYNNKIKVVEKENTVLKEKIRYQNRVIDHMGTSSIAQQKADESGTFNKNNFYDFTYDIRPEYMNIQTAALIPGIPIGILDYEDPKNDEEIKSSLSKNKKVMHQYIYTINEDLLQILGQKWKTYYDDIGAGKHDIDIDIKKYGKEIRVVDWIQYPTAEITNATISVTDNEWKSLEDLLKLYKGNGGEK